MDPKAGPRKPQKGRCDLLWMWLKVLDSEHVAAIVNLWPRQSITDINAVFKRSDESILGVKVRMQDRGWKVLQSLLNQCEDLRHGEVVVIAQKNFIAPIRVHPLIGREYLRSSIEHFHFDYNIILNFDPRGRLADGTRIADDLEGVVGDFKSLPFELCLRELIANACNSQRMFCGRNRVIQNLSQN